MMNNSKHKITAECKECQKLLVKDWYRIYWEGYKYFCSEKCLSKWEKKTLPFKDYYQCMREVEKY